MVQETADATLYLAYPKDDRGRGEEAKPRLPVEGYDAKYVASQLHDDILAHEDYRHDKEQSLALPEVAEGALPAQERLHIKQVP